MLLLALLLQPAFALYTRCVMEQAASEGLRALATFGPKRGGGQDSCVAYVRRRLRAVPNVPAFHVGGEEGLADRVRGLLIDGSLERAGCGAPRALPLVGVLASAFGEVEEGEVVLRVEVSRVRGQTGWRATMADGPRFGDRGRARAFLGIDAFVDEQLGGYTSVSVAVARS